MNALLEVSLIEVADEVSNVFHLIIQLLLDFILDWISLISKVSIIVTKKS